MNDYNEQVLKEAMQKIIEEEHKEILKEMEIAKTIPEFQVKEGEAEAFVEKYMPKKSNKKKTLLRVASVAVAVLVCFSAVTLSVDGFRNRFTEFLSNFSNSDHASVDIGNSKNDELLLSYKGQYVPTYIPEGYTVQSVSNESNHGTIFLKNNDGFIIIFKEQSSTMKTDIDTKNAEIVKNIEINGMKGVYVLKDGEQSIAVSTEQTIIYIYCDDDKLDLIGFAELVEQR